MLVISFQFYKSFNSNFLDRAAGKHSFSIVNYELRNIPLKWTHLIWSKFPGNQTSKSEIKKITSDYFDLAYTINNMNQYSNKTKEIKQLIIQKELLKARTEQHIETTINKIALEQGLGIFSSILFPPVDIKLGQPPGIIITSPRNEINMLQTKLVKGGLSWRTKESIEFNIESSENLSALVDSLSGLGTYPALVSDIYDLNMVLQTASHEWLHNYWIFKPLGRNMWDSDEMYILNESAANLAGNELGNQAYKIIGIPIDDNIKPNTNLYIEKTLRETRIRVDSYLVAGEIKIAEAYMETQKNKINDQGYSIRKLNQAYFAFRGNYADSPSSTSPIWDQLVEFRSYCNSIGEFILKISGIHSYKDFEVLLEKHHLKNS